MVLITGKISLRTPFFGISLLKLNQMLRMIRRNGIKVPFYLNLSNTTQMVLLRIEEFADTWKITP